MEHFSYVLISSKHPALCTHIKINGTQCGSPALRRNRYCFFHRKWRDQQIRLNAKHPECATFELPVLEDNESVQVAVMQVMRLILARQIDSKTAGLLLYALQTASLNLKHARFEPILATRVVIDPRKVDETPLGEDPWDEDNLPEEDDEDDQQEENNEAGEPGEAEPDEDREEEDTAGEAEEQDHDQGEDPEEDRQQERDDEVAPECEPAYASQPEADYYEQQKEELRKALEERRARAVPNFAEIRAGIREIVIDAAERMGVPTDPPPTEQFWRDLETNGRSRS